MLLIKINIADQIDLSTCPVDRLQLKFSRVCIDAGRHPLLWYRQGYLLFGLGGRPGRR